MRTQVQRAASTGAFMHVALCIVVDRPKPIRRLGTEGGMWGDPIQFLFSFLWQLIGFPMESCLAFLRNLACIHWHSKWKP